jgi:two-component system, NtrC family, response regulator GlrR
MAGPMTCDPEAPDWNKATTPLSSSELSGHQYIQRFRLIALSGPDEGTMFTSHGARVVIGKHASADLCLQDPAVSRFHCEIALTDKGALLKDLGSSNGTVVNGLSVVSAYLPPNAQLTIGQTTLKFDIGAEHVRIKLSKRPGFGRMVGVSPAMREVFALLERAADSSASLLLEGETGTGKEIAVESVHEQGPRRDGPLVVVDCGAIPAELLESELFGHKLGAFTGAVSDRVGAFEAASGGTLFLDEIGELPTELQPKLLRALERREVKPVGSTSYVPVDLRIVSATSRNLRAEVNAGRFRSDLYYRLAVLEVRLPPLRERVSDLPVLVQQLLERLGGADRPENAMLRSESFLEQLAGHHWPGNVRELGNYLERCVALHECAQFETADAERAEPLVDPTRTWKVVRERGLRALERRYLTKVLELHDGNVSKAARAAGLDRSAFYRLLWRQGLR